MFIQSNIIFVSLTSVFEPTKAGASKYACWLAQKKKKKMEILDTWVFLAQTNSSVSLRLSLGGLIWQPRMQLSGVTVRVYCVPRREMSCVVWGRKGPPLWCHPLWCHAQGQTNVFRKPSPRFRQYAKPLLLQAELAHLSLCCAWAVFQVRDENENAPFVWNWSHCYLYETPFFQIQAQKKRGLDFPFEKPEVIDAGPWVDKNGFEYFKQDGFR